MALTILRLATLYGEGDRGNVGRLMRTPDRGRFLWIGGGIGILAAFLFVSIVAGVPLGLWASAAFLAVIGFLDVCFLGFSLFGFSARRSVEGKA